VRNGDPWSWGRRGYKGLPQVKRNEYAGINGAVYGNCGGERKKNTGTTEEERQMEGSGEHGHGRKKKGGKEEKEWEADK